MPALGAGNLLAASQTVNTTHFRFTAFSKTILASFAAGGVDGSAFDGTNYYSADAASPAKFFKHSGFSATISSSFTKGVVNDAISWDGTNLSSAEAKSPGTGIVVMRLFTGFTNTLKSSFTFSPSGGSVRAGISLDGSGNYYSKKNVGQTSPVSFLRFSKFSVTILSSFTYNKGGTDQNDWSGLTLAVNSNNDLMAHHLSKKIWRFSGFTTTVKNSFTYASNFGDVEWDQRFAKVVIRSLLPLLGVGN